MFLQKVHVHVETFPQKVENVFDVSFSRLFFVLSRFRVFLGAGSSKTLQKMFCKKTVSKSFTKKSTKNPNCFFSLLFYPVLGHFSVRGVQKHDKK
jgi:hypothetical protein